MSKLDIDSRADIENVISKIKGDEMIATDEYVLQAMRMLDRYSDIAHLAQEGLIGKIPAAPKADDNRKAQAARLRTYGSGLVRAWDEYESDLRAAADLLDGAASWAVPEELRQQIDLIEKVAQETRRIAEVNVGKLGDRIANLEAKVREKWVGLHDRCRELSERVANLETET